ncbi:MAG: polysaccharide biosynthesis/export family protein [Nitrospirota bacterium]
MAFAIMFLYLFPISGMAQDSAISNGDLLKITVYGNDDLTTETLVSSEGTITFPLIGEANVGGLSVHQAEKRIANLLSKGYIRNPHVNILITETKNVVYVTGEVQKPGSYKADPDTTVLKAIALAGGLTDKAAPGRTKITRRVDGQESTMSANMSDPVKPDDVINVPESFF